MSAQPVRNLCATYPRTRMVKPFAQLRNLRNLLIGAGVQLSG